MDEEQAIGLLKKYAPSEKVFEIVYKHVKAVQELALEIASEIPDVDMDFISVAALLHDIGRFKVEFPDKKVQHGVIGAEILRKEGLDEKFALVCKRHVGVGISKEDIKIKGLDLPMKDYLPVSKEEKIISHADNLIFGNKRGTLDMVIQRFRKELGEEYIERVKKLAKEVEEMKKK